MITWGISANSHDAAISVVQDDKIVFAAHSERYSRIKNDADLCRGLIEDAKQHGDPDRIVWYEKPLLKTIRQIRAGQGFTLWDNRIGHYLAQHGLPRPHRYVGHHHSHAAGGYYTSGFGKATVVCVDAIGELDTVSIWRATGSKLKKARSAWYPHSLGLFYSAMTQRVGLKPNEDEYILMGMAAYGDPWRLYSRMVHDFFDFRGQIVSMRQNLHRGCLDWMPELRSEQDLRDIAAAAQRVYEVIFDRLVIREALRVSPDHRNLVLTGGCALNCVANSRISRYWDNIWIMPNPGDAGSSLGAALADRSKHIDWSGPFLGHNIEGDYPVEAVLAELTVGSRICGVANGRAEFGPRALGNRSLLADPRGLDIKDRVNAIKQRQQFRPFAPAILEEYASQYFDGPVGPYMQYTARCRDPDQFPAVVHADGTSRVQTVGPKDNPGFRRLLERWHAETGCPMLLNTSLNIKGEPLVNTRKDAQAFQEKYGVKVF